MRKRSKILTIVTILCILCICLVGCDDKTNKIAIDEKATFNSEKSSESSIEKQSDNNDNSEIYVHIVGKIKYPGVYKMAQGDRIYDVIKMAGGMTKGAKEDYLNQAEKVVDGQKIEVISKKQYRKMLKNNGGLNSGASIGAGAGGSASAGSNANTGSVGNGNTGPGEDGKAGSNAGAININTASESELTSLSGIGQSKARAIIQYRTDNGNFSKVDDIKNVSGIGEATFNNIKDSITVR